MEEKIPVYQVTLLVSYRKTTGRDKEDELPPKEMTSAEAKFPVPSSLPRMRRKTAITIES